MPLRLNAVGGRVEGDLGRRGDDVGGVDRLGRRRARGDLLGRQVVDRGALGVGRVDVAARGDVEVVDEGRRAVAALGVERRQQCAAGDVVDLDRAGGRAGRVQPSVLHLQAGGRLACRAGDEDGHRRRGVAQLAAVDAAVAGGRDEEEAAALVEGHALGVAVLRLGQRVDVRGALVADLAGSGVVPVVVACLGLGVAIVTGVVAGVVVTGLVLAAVLLPAPAAATA
jgi:hypothetical protein